jgi:hypothetical protein
MDDAAAGARLVPKAPKYTREQLWFMVSLGISVPVMVIAAWLHDMHLLKIATMVAAGSLTLAFWSVIRMMRSSGEFYWSGWGRIDRDKSPVLWVGVLGSFWLMLLMLGSFAIATLLSLA